jgi:rhodanese-related sulfurtransferase
MKDPKRQDELTRPAQHRLTQLGVLAAITALLVVLALAACQTSPMPGGQPASAPAAAVPTAAAATSGAGANRASLPAEISVAEAAAKRDAGAFILDVRTPDEWKDFHVPGSTLIPIDELPNRVAEVPKDKEVVVVCRSGNRSATGRDVLLKAGYPQVTSLAGGLTAWRNAGKPVQ